MTFSNDSNMKIRLLIPFLVALCASANAASISFDTVGSASGGMLATDTAGVNGVANWNVLNASATAGGPIAGSLAAGSIKDSAGTTLATTTLTWTGTGQANAGAGTGTNDNKMFSSEWDLFDAVGSRNTHMTFTLTNIPYAVYDVYFYVLAGSNAEDRGGNVTANGITESIMMYNFSTGATGAVPPTSTSYIDANSPFSYSDDNTGNETGRGTYVRLQNITGSELTLLISAQNPGVPRLRMSGFQVVQVPEISSSMLVLLSSTLMLAKRRRA